MAASMVKGKSYLASNKVFRVRILVEVLETGGVRGVAVSAHRIVNPKVGVRIPSDTLERKESIMVATLTRPTLVLNRNWQPVGVASVARSLTLVAAERARIVDPSDFKQYAWADW